MAADGHLDCMFDCGLKFSSLEELYLHVELDHREDNSVSPFAVDEAVNTPASQPRAYADDSGPPLPARPTSSRSKQPNHATNYGQEQAPFHGGASRGNHDAAEAEETFVLCPEQDCGELILVTDLNDHLDFHDAQQACLDEEPPSSSASLAPTSLARKQLNGHSSSSSSSRFTTENSGRSSPQPNRKAMEQHSADRSKSDRDSQDDGLRARLGRKVRDTLMLEKRSKERVPSGKSANSGQRLGKAELGPHAFEAQMPVWMYRKLKDGPKVTKTRRISRNGGLITHESVEGQCNGVMPILRQLIDLDREVYTAYLCHPSVTQIGKRTWETGFCGYHNTQMSISYIQNSKHPAHTLFPGFIPSILDIQDWVETAWDEGINPHAKLEIGGLRGTRKWIGTLEVDTLFQYMGIPHRIHQFHDTLETNNQYADQNLLDWVESYFRDAAVDDGSKVKCTLKPPIYFQRPGHSLTIVGVEKMKDGKRNLLVFDPMYQVPAAMLAYIEKGRARETNAKLLRLYRRSQNRLYNYADFEATTLEGDLPLFPAWDVLQNHHHSNDRLVTVIDWHWQVRSLNDFVPTFCLEFCGSVFRADEARFLPPATPSMCNLCVPQVWSREAPGVPLWFEKWLVQAGDQCRGKKEWEFCAATNSHEVEDLESRQHSPEVHQTAEDEPEEHDYEEDESASSDMEAHLLAELRSPANDLVQLWARYGLMR